MFRLLLIIALACAQLSTAQSEIGVSGAFNRTWKSISDTVFLNASGVFNRRDASGAWAADSTVTFSLPSRGGMLPALSPTIIFKQKDSAGTANAAFSVKWRVTYCFDGTAFCPPHTTLYNSDRVIDTIYTSPVDTCGGICATELNIPYNATAIRITMTKTGTTATTNKQYYIFQRYGGR